VAVRIRFPRPEFFTVVVAFVIVGAWQWRMFALPPPRKAIALLPEPRAARQFVSAYARVDEDTISRLTSPLYHFELARRGYGDRLAVVPVPWDDTASRPATPWLRFTYLDGIADSDGFTHLLYLARSTLVDERRAPTTVWRVDLDPEGRIIWAEMVFGFGEAKGYSVHRTMDVHLRDLPEIPVPQSLQPIWPSLQPQVLLTVTSVADQCYYALGLVPKGKALAGGGVPDIVIFFATDEDHHVFPDAWSYGERIFQSSNSLDAEPVITSPVAHDQLDDALWHRYLVSLW
jgi:hypothetical protein